MERQVGYGAKAVAAEACASKARHSDDHRANPLGRCLSPINRCMHYCSALLSSDCRLRQASSGRASWLDRCLNILTDMRVVCRSASVPHLSTPLQHGGC